MNIHEHQAKELLASQNVKVAKGFPAFSVNEAIEVAKRIGGPIWVVKAQIHAGGRGKAGGVKVVKSIEELEEAAKEILGKTLITPQTGPSGKEVKRLARTLARSLRKACPTTRFVSPCAHPCARQ